MTAPVAGTVGVLYPSGAVCPVGGAFEALKLAETAHVSTCLVRYDGADWRLDMRLPVPRPRLTATPKNPARLAISHH